jgi:sugar phosphate isomerase/epimerase
MKLGLVTYQMGAAMSVDELIAFCLETGLEGVELRATHAHGVETTLTGPERGEVRRKFEDSPVAISGLGSAFEFHSPDAAELKENIEGAKEYAQLAADVGAESIKVRPNNLPEDVPPEKTLAQIAQGWDEVAKAAADIGIEVRMEVHGRHTQNPGNFLEILKHSEHPNATVCWNSNPAEMNEDKEIGYFFDQVQDRLGQCHITDIGVYQYPWQELFDRLKAMNYTGWCLAEIQPNPEPVRFMKYYRTLFDLYTTGYRWPQ